MEGFYLLSCDRLVVISATYLVSCRKQEDLVQNVRRRLEEALMADMLAHIEDTAAEAATNNVEEKVEKVDGEKL